MRCWCREAAETTTGVVALANPIYEVELWWWDRRSSGNPPVTSERIHGPVYLTSIGYLKDNFLRRRITHRHKGAENAAKSRTDLGVEKSKCRPNSSPSWWAWPSRAHRTCSALCLYIMRTRVGAHEASQASRNRQRVSIPAACYRHRGSYPPPSIVPLPLLARRHAALSHTRLLGTFVAGLRASAPTVTFSTGRAPGVATSSSVRRPSARR